MPCDEPGEDAVAAATRLVRGLDCSCLPIQGPPGTGKTFTSAHAIVDLIVAGKRVGITANSHAVITNLLDEVMRAAATRKVVITAMQKIDGGGCAHPDVTAVNDSKTVESALAAGEVQLVAGTAWLFARPGWRSRSTTSSSTRRDRCRSPTSSRSARPTRNLVLVGDPQQLSQPSTGTHPAGAGVAALEHLLDGQRHRAAGARSLPREDVPDAPGRSRRSCRSCRTRTASSRSTHAVGSGSWAAARSAGTDCAGSPSSTRATSCRPTRRPRRLLAATSCSSEAVGSAPTASSGRSRSLTSSSSLRTTPRCTRSGGCCPTGARVGTVDKFQGQEARDRDRVDGDIERRRRATRSGVPAQREPPQRRRLTGAGARHRRRQPDPADHRVQVAPSDPTRQRSVPLRRARARLSAARLTIRPARLAASGCPPPADRRCTTGGRWRGPARNT